MKRITFTQIKKNIIRSVSAQLVSLIVNIIINLFIPRYISEWQYAHWQMYVLYVGYVGVLHFGLLDGIILRYSGYDLEELNKKVLCSQFEVLLFVTGICSFLLLAISNLVFEGSYSLVFTFVSMGVITKNIVTYSSFLFQISNRIDKYARLVILQKSILGVLIFGLLILKVDNFCFFCLADLFSDLIVFSLCSKDNRGLYFHKSFNFRETVHETISNISSGFLLLVANWSSLLVIGIAKSIVQIRWGLFSFSKVSFAFSITNLFLTLVTAVSVVLFPSIKRLDEEQLPKLYLQIRSGMSVFLFAVMLLYYPGCRVLMIWLPKYQESLVYLGVLLPIIIFSSKVGLLTNNYLKAYRNEAAMLWINVLTVVITTVLCGISAVVLESMDALLIGVVISTMIRSVVSEVVLSKKIGYRFTADYFMEAVMSFAFIACAKMPAAWMGMTTYFVVFFVYFLIIKRKKPTAE